MLHACIFFNIDFQNSKLLQPVYYSGSVLVPNHGWFLFGGIGNKLTTAQKLADFDGNWESGPSLYENHEDYYNCVLQVGILYFLSFPRHPF